MAAFCAVVAIPIYLATNWFSNSWNAVACPAILSDKALDTPVPEMSEAEVKRLQKAFNSLPLTPEIDENAIRELDEQQRQAMLAMRERCKKFEMENPS